MRTWGSFDSSNGRVAMQTWTHTDTMFGGFHGGVTLICNDANSAPTWQSQGHRYGVDGWAIGRSDRTDAWWEQMSSQQAAATTGVQILHYWNPDSFDVVMAKWVNAGKKISDVVAAFTPVAKVVAALF